MGKSIESLVSFAAGQWSPTLTSRVDQQKYRAACLQLKNMLCLKTGPASRRAGLEFIAPCKVIDGGNYCARMLEFQFSTLTAFALEFGHQYVRFYSNGAQVVLSTAPGWVTGTNYPAGSFVEDPGATPANTIYYSPGGINGGSTQPHLDGANWIQQSIYEVPSPYSALAGSGPISDTEVFQLQVCEINDVVYIVHPSHPRQKLVRFGDTNWVMSPVLDLIPPLLDQNATDTTIASSATSGTTTLTATAPGWVTATFYDIGSSVLNGGSIYECLVPHVSGTFATDLAAGDWQLVTVFQAGHVGAFWELAYLRDSAYIEYDGTAGGGFAAGTSNTITAFGSWEVHSYGVWSADIKVQASSDGANTWQTVRTITGRNDRNLDIRGTALQAQLYRLVITNVAVPITPGPTNPRIVFECVDAFLYGIVQITAVADALHATAKVITPLTVANEWVSGATYALQDRVGFNGINYICILAVSGSSTNPGADGTHWSADGWPTIFWSEGAWSDVRGYPAAITAFEQRMWCGFTAFQPQRIWGTQTDNIENWDLGDQTLATDGVAFDLDAVADGGILWMQSQDSLFVGMVSSEWVVQPADSTTSIGPTNITAHRQSKWGSNPNIPARIVGDALVFVQRQGFSMRQMLFSVVTNKYMSQDLTALSDQILNLGAIQLAYQKQGNKNGYLWATTANGELVGMTYELDQEIFGWHRHVTGEGIDGGFESVCTIEGSGTNDDEVWVVVNRMIGGIQTRYVERINPYNWQNQRGGAQKNRAYYVDCGGLYAGPISNVFTGLDRLDGRDVTVCINGEAYGIFTVVSGSITVDNYTPVGGNVDVAIIGLPYDSILQPMNLDVDVHTGVTLGITKKVAALFISFLNTLSCTVSNGSGQEKQIIFRTQATLGQETPLFTGRKEVKDFPGLYGYEIPIILKTSDPLPLTVLSVAVDYNTAGNV